MQVTEGKYTTDIKIGKLAGGEYNVPPVFFIRFSYSDFRIFVYSVYEVLYF